MAASQQYFKIDDLDKNILTLLMEDGKMPYAEIGKKLFCSPGTVHGRVKKLEQMGVIEKQQIKVNYKALGFDIAAFIGIFLESSSMYTPVSNQLAQIDEVTGLHYTTGSYSLFAKIHCMDTDHLMEVLHEKIQSIKGIQRTETLISLKENLNRSLKII